MSESPSKVVPRSPYVEDETDEEFAWEKEAAKEAEAETDDRICRIRSAGSYHHANAGIFGMAWFFAQFSTGER